MSEHADFGLERIVFFSDAVMAIAITLLAIDIKVPEISAVVAATELPARLQDLTPRIISFVISFAVIGVYWASHHRYFGFIRRYDGGLMVLNLVFLLFIVLMPCVAGLLGHYGYLPLGAAAYAAAVAGTGLSISAVWWYASHNYRLVDRDLSPEFIRTRNVVGLIVPGVFLISIPCTFFSPLLAMALWWVAPFVAIFAMRQARRHQAPRAPIT